MNILITGASRGIGFELVKHFSASEENVVIAVSRNENKLNELKNWCEKNNSKANVLIKAFDLHNEKEIEKLFVFIKQHISNLNIVINNAGALLNKPFLNISQTELAYTYGVNLFSVVKVIQLSLPMMLNNSQRNHVVNISSIGGFQGSLKFAGLSAYSSSKAALCNLTECLAEEFKDANVSFNCLALGAVQTEMLNEAFPGYKAPLTANEMAKFIVQFASTAQHFMNGKIVPVSISNP